MDRQHILEVAAEGLDETGIDLLEPLVVVRPGSRKQSTGLK
jgi:hypothetical protein